ncbi:hypothetical protein ABZS88_38965 [Streptomyces sp. NPDC005480]
MTSNSPPLRPVTVSVASVAMPHYVEIGFLTSGLRAAWWGGVLISALVAS